MGSDVEVTVFRGSKSGEIVESKYKHGPLVRDEVLVETTASGLCGTDLHFRNKDMGLGHEGVGLVKALGPDAKLLKVGDRVGWGYMHESCGHCEQCLTGKEIYCDERHMYGKFELDQGSFSSGAVWRESYLYKIPDGLADDEAAPLMCGGATVWTPLIASPSTARVGIVGIGGLGHLAIQFASKLGREVVVFSGTDSKREEAMKLGATEFYAAKGKDKLDIGRKIDLLIVTTSAQPDWKLYLPLMNYNSEIHPLSASADNLSIPYMPLLDNGISITGSLIAPRASLRNMLHFAARHGIKPMKMTFDLNKEGIEKAIQTLVDGKMRYRGVLIPPTNSRL